ncbi:MAG: hypothetical protein PHU34_03245 [Candidatus Methanoperedens sp.]|nr:hypothetical protein [Candidatus Methanoperedens sp.]
MTRLEAWATKISDVADHTYVYCPQNGQYFNCWGGHDGPDQRMICAGEGIYEVANCYRKPAFGHDDTAGIGAYGVNGVCHQTANLFMYSSRQVLDLRVRGYIFSVAAYGIYGTAFPFGKITEGIFFGSWLLAVYNPCYQRYKDSNIAKSATPKMNLGEGSELFKKIQKCHNVMLTGMPPEHPHDVTVQEFATLVRHIAPGIDIGIFDDLQRDLLKERDALLKTGIQGKQLADKMNDLVKEFQKGLSDRVGPGLYQKLTGLEAGETINIIDPEIAASVAKNTS